MIEHTVPQIAQLERENERREETVARNVQERDRALDACDALRKQRDLARAELASARTELERLRSTTPTSKETSMPAPADDGSRAEALLDLPLPANDADAPTVRDYLIALLREAWEQGENFCKRPFGNSGWQYEVYAPMVKAGLVTGTIDSDGQLDDVDTRAADALMDEAIQALGVAAVDVDGHIIEVRATGWTIMHPLACRPRLFECEVNRAAERDLTEPPAALGRFRCDAATGRFAIGGQLDDAPDRGAS